mgnify:CR=1 FL=1
MTLITNLETLATPDRYVYVGLERSSRFIFPCQFAEERLGPRETPLVEQDGEHARGGDRRVFNEEEEEEDGEEEERKEEGRKEIGLITHDNVRRRHDG